MDLTFQILLNDNTRDYGDALANAQRFQSGSIINVFPATKYATKQGNNYLMFTSNGDPSFGWVHVVGIPDWYTVEETISKMKEILCANVQEPWSESEVPQDETYVKMRMVRKREWRVLISAMTGGTRNEMLNNRETTLTWGQAKSLIRKKIVIDSHDSSLDDEITELTDLDFS